jgi:hypothetical protein
MCTAEGEHQLSALQAEINFKFKPWHRPPHSEGGGGGRGERDTHTQRQRQRETERQRQRERERERERESKPMFCLNFFPMQLGLAISGVFPQGYH